jgi:hypothetical protein
MEGGLTEEKSKPISSPPHLFLMKKEAWVKLLEIEKQD